jgi:hypothetical protein
VAQGLAEHGIGPRELEQVCRGGRAQAREQSQQERERLLDELSGPGGLTAQASTFARRDLLDALAKRLPMEVSPDRALASLEDLADEFLGSPRAVLVAVDRGLDEPRYSTPELLGLERGLVELVASKCVRAVKNPLTATISGSRW